MESNEKTNYVYGVVVDVDFLRFREKANLGSNVLDLIPSGTTVIVHKSYPNKLFYKVEHNGQVGYCVKTFIKLIEK